MKRDRKTTTYSEAFKAEVLQRVLESDAPISVIARELGIKKSTLYTWVYQHRRGQEKEGGEDPSTPHQELMHLKKEVRRLKEERDILKKAKAYFTRESK